MVQVRQITTISDEQKQELVNLLMDSVEGGASMGFLAPLSEEKARAYWNDVEKALQFGLRVFVAEAGSSIVGSVQLSPCPKENGKHRAEILKLFVLRSHRRMGIAKQLMQYAQEYAATLKCSLLILDTHEGSNAEVLYRSIGWIKAGIIPGYASNPDGVMYPTAFYYKEL
ncbi:GNAT family N-acetyltransferase [Halodesulfovibrio spirochaetisodalis]|uniref:N-acetyltransferase domain-containing protein n=1 Tax=Halodesulfovibrio spirochaetisodalis TaxID=1560234 RepID=A0A1B7X9G8_9BACT|nr:GNAT family N-acetyltransferase [Halodesulfovibrio spirochaetisodalis]OBQ45998.1 hypothetical protein SP90_15000 [Halodesulfovibrio spirochaetisodalis]